MSRAIVRRALIVLALAFLVIVYGGDGLSHEPAASPGGGQAQRRELRRAIADFSLVDQAGRPFSFHKLKGKIVVVSFVYATCPDICPLITANLRVVQERLDAVERGNVYFLSVTTDPEIDTSGVLKSYGKRYKLDFSNWSLVGGDPQSLARVWKMFGVRVEKKARGLVNHTTLTALVDRKSLMRVAYVGAEPDSAKILEDLRRLIDD